MMRRWIRVTSFLALLLVAPWPAQAIQWGAGTGSSYPTTLDTANNRTNVGGGSCSSATTTNICKEWLNDWQGAVIAIMTELGTLPKGGSASVKARLDAVDTSLSGKVTAVTGSGNIASSGGTTPNITFTGVLPTANGGTGIAYFTAAGPSIARVYTFPDAAATMLYSGGALGTPSSGTLTNATGLPAASVLAGTFGTGAYVMDTSLTLPTLIGGTGTTSTLVLQPTSGVGATGADIIFKVGNNGATEAGRILADGRVGIMKSPSTGVALDVNGVLQVTSAGIYLASTGVQLNRSGSNLFLKASNSGAEIRLYSGNASTWVAIVGNTSDISHRGANGQSYTLGYKTELTTIAAAATTVTIITIPANAILKAVEMRVTVQPPGTSTMVVTATTSGTVLQQGASMSTALNTTDVGTRAWGTNYVGVAAQTITITPNAVPSDATGRVRFDIYYDEPVAATS